METEGRNTGPKKDLKCKLQLLEFHVWYPRAWMSLSSWLCCLRCSPLSWAASTTCVRFSAADVPHLWHFNRFKVSNTIQAPLSQLQEVAPQGLHTGTSLPRAWLQQLSVTTEEDSLTLSLLYPSWFLSQYHVADTAKFCHQLGTKPDILEKHP